MGFRPVDLLDARFEQKGGGGYLNKPHGKLGLPTRLDEGEQLRLAFHAEDIEPDTTALVIQDTHRRQHRLDFAAGVADQLQAFREMIEETEPRLLAEGQERLAAVMRRDLEEAHCRAEM